MGRKRKEKGRIGTDQFAELTAAVVRALPRDMDPDVAQCWINNQRALAGALHKALLMPPDDYELYWHPEQEGEGVIPGFQIYDHLVETGRIHKALSLESPEVDGWIADPSTYPDEFKNKTVTLWGSISGSGDHRLVAYLVWEGGCVVSYWCWLVASWGRGGPALLHLVKKVGVEAVS